MYGELTSADTQAKIRDALENCHIEQVEVLLYKKNSMFIDIPFCKKNIYLLFI
jgi:hypothetical protein